MGPLADGIATILDLVLNMIQLMVLASIIISWVGADPSNQIVTAIRAMTEPLYKPIRKMTANFPGPLDWAPMILLLVVIFIQRGLVPYIRMLGGPVG